jgi:hypothetical protein
MSGARPGDLAHDVSAIQGLDRSGLALLFLKLR